MGNRELIAPYTDYFARPLDDVVHDLESYAQLLRKWQGVQNLVSRETLDQMWDRHFVDSLQVLKWLNVADENFLDIGSGGGFPALPLAIALKDTSARFTLIDPTSRKVSFLRTVSRELGLNANIMGQRSDEISPNALPATDVITSRALAALPQLCSWMAPFFTTRTRAVLHKGREHVEEVKQTLPLWSFDVLSTPSDTDPNGVLLTISNLRKKSVC